MSKFKKGDVVIVVDNSCRHDFEIGSKVRVESEFSNGYQARSLDNPSERWAVRESDIVAETPATPTEHPALTLAKAEVVRIRALSDVTFRESVRLVAFTEVLRTFGLTYRAKPVVPQPPEYEFAPVQDAG